MSQRTSDKNGVAIMAEGGDGAPAELDPMGSNVGLLSPYIEIELGSQPEYPMLLEMFADSPMYVNGQRVTCSLDGFGIPCGRAMEMLETGSAIPAQFAQYQHDPRFQFRSHGLGIFSVYTVTGYRDISPPSNPNSPTVNTVDQRIWGWTTFTLPNSTVTWSTQQTQQTVSMTENEIGDLRNKALAGLTEKCAGFIEKVAAAVLGRDFDDKTGEPLMAADILGEAFDRVKNSPRDIDGRLRGFTWGWVKKGSGGMAGYGRFGKLNENVAQIQFPTGANVQPLGIRHELLHVALRSDDMQLSQVVKDLGIPVFTDSGKPSDYPTDLNNDNFAYSGYWGQALKNHCPDPLPNRLPTR